MHYGPSMTPPTLTVINPTTCTNVGQRIAPSAEDFVAADYIYGRVTVPTAGLVTIDQELGQLDVFVADRFGSLAVKWVTEEGAPGRGRWK